MRDFDRKIAAFYWGFWVLIAAVLTVPMLVVAGSGRRADTRAAIAVVAIVLPALILIVLGVTALLRSLKRNDGVLSTLEHLRRELGGVAVLPTLGSPFVQPRLVTTHRGRELEVRFVRMSGAQALAHGGEWHLMVMLACQPRLRFGLVSRQLWLAPRAHLVGLLSADWDSELMLVAEDLARGAALLRDPGVYGFTQQIFAITPKHAKLQLAPITTLNPLGSTYLGAWNPYARPESARAIVDSVTAIVERLHLMGAA